MQITSLVPFCLLMSIFIGLGFLLCRVLPPYNSEVGRLPARRGYHVELESMRGLLALAVVVHHALVWHVLMYYHTSYITGPNATFYSQLGTAPVTFFFFITGFLFWSKLISDPKPRAGKFLVGRLRRLGPAYLGSAAMMFTLVALFTHFKLDGSPIAVARDAVRMILGRQTELNGMARAPWLWAVTWTLQFEFLFYLLVPFLGWFAQTLWKTMLFIGGCNVLYAASLVAVKHATHLPGMSLLQALLRFLSFTFCVGFITAHLVKVPAIRGFARSIVGAPVALALIVATLFFLPAEHGPLESLMLTIPFVAVACGCDFWGALRKKTFLFLGQISYSVYLVHCLVFGAVLIPLSAVLHAELANAAVYWVVMFLTGPVIIGVAIVWNRSFELPFMMRGTAAVVKPLLPDLVNMPYAKASESH